MIFRIVTPSSIELSLQLSLVSAMSYESRCGGQVFAQTGHYHGVAVRIKELKFSKKKDISRDVMKEMRILREIRHGNLNSFIGACVEPMRILLITDYCAKGSLYVRHLNTRMNVCNLVCWCFQRMIALRMCFRILSRTKISS